MANARVLVFGATSAVAAAVCERLAARGDRLFLVGRNPVKLQQLEARLQSAIVGTWVADLDDLEMNPQVVETGIAALGGLDIALIAHGVLGSQPQSEESFAAAEGILRTNFLSAVSLLIPLANALECQTRGKIMVLSSVAGERGRPRNYTYGAAKGALTLFLQGLRSRLWSRGIDIYTIKLGPVITPMTEHHTKNRLFATTEEVSARIVRILERRGGEFFVPRYWWPILAVVRCLPEPLFQKLTFLSGR